MRAVDTLSLADRLKQREDRREQLLREARRASCVLRAAGAHSVWVFGSVARGDAGAGSDLDLAVVLPEQPGATRLDQATALLMTLHSPLAVDLLIFRPDEWADAQEHPMFREAREVRP